MNLSHAVGLTILNLKFDEEDHIVFFIFLDPTVMSSPLLVLTQYVYAKKQDGGFYSGRVEGKENENSYNIAFSDYTRSTVDENDLVWLGFYSLPPNIWPKSPAIHPINVPKDDTGIYNGEIKREVDDFLSRRPESLRLLKSAKDWVRNGEKKLSAEKYNCSNEHCRCGDEKMTNLESVPTDEDKIHSGPTRSSVLRLNKKALSAEISQTQNKRERCPPSMDTKTTGDECTRYNEMKERYISTAR